ncbi:astacin [Ancylostoma caninum]|uniref:Metalloendopeptidase n=1 Tax=Ancylostoma caninum TaxID=29170 RepID=A0A368GW34_ANCCA|nr:astacin [Ancylostoma caninum]
MKTILIIFFLAIHVSRPVFGDIMQELFLKTARAWEKDTCVEFKEKKGGPKLTTGSTIFVYGDDKKYFDCSFNESPNEGKDHLLSVGCGYFGGAAHEVGHALGLIHTHTRYDRDAYLIVNSTNVEREYRKSYEDEIKGRKESDVKRQIEKYEEVQYGKSKTMSNYYGVPYDYGSIMHYGTADTNPPMIPTDKNHKRTMGSQFISFLDLLEVNKRYDCLGDRQYALATEGDPVEIGFCSKDDKGVQLESKKSPVPIITYSMTTAPLHVTLKYRSVSTKA